jgi:FkbM family methyltransferase
LSQREKLLNIIFNKYKNVVSRHGAFKMLRTEQYILGGFDDNCHWCENELALVLPLIPPGCNIVEVGAHVGTHTVPYARVCRQIFAFEPQAILFDLLERNIKKNKIRNATVFQGAACHYTGRTRLSARFPDGCSVNQPVNYNKRGNFGGLCLGESGEEAPCFKLDDMKFGDVGFMHVDAQGAQALVLYGAQNLIRECRPILYVEDEFAVFRDSVARSPQIEQIAFDFDFRRFCAELGYTATHHDGMTLYTIPT